MAIKRGDWCDLDSIEKSQWLYEKGLSNNLMYRIDKGLSIENAVNLANSEFSFDDIHKSAPMAHCRDIVLSILLRECDEYPFWAGDYFIFKKGKFLKCVKHIWVEIYPETEDGKDPDLDEYQSYYALKGLGGQTYTKKDIPTLEEIEEKLITANPISEDLIEVEEDGVIYLSTEEHKNIAIISKEEIQIKRITKRETGYPEEIPMKVSDFLYLMQAYYKLKRKRGKRKK